jgi:Protein of unknown function (DUF3795)
MKQQTTIGCCGIDCGLCPRYHTDGPSACPGCGAANFKDHHPSCGYVTCCVTKRGFETCADCPDFPCSRFDAERKGRDSFVTHRKVFDNIEDIRQNGLETFMNQQRQRMDILLNLLDNFNEGRSKSYFCQACALLPISDLEALKDTLPTIPAGLDIKAKNKLIRSLIELLAVQRGLDLKLRHQ